MAANQNGREYTSGFTIIDMLSINRTCERSTVPSSGVSKYLTPLLVHHGEPVIYGMYPSVPNHLEWLNNNITCLCIYIYAS